jgi:hypothetical protein
MACLLGHPKGAVQGRTASIERSGSITFRHKKSHKRICSFF